MDWFKAIMELMKLLPSLLDAILKMINGIKHPTFSAAALGDADKHNLIDELISALHKDKAALPPLAVVEADPAP